MTLTCDTSCELSGLTRIIWFRNERPVDKPVRFQASAEDAGNYTCAVEGQESVRSDPVFLDVQCEHINDIIVGLNKSSVSENHYYFGCIFEYIFNSVPFPTITVCRIIALLTDRQFI